MNENTWLTEVRKIVKSLNNINNNLALIDKRLESIDRDIKNSYVLCGSIEHGEEKQIDAETKEL